MADFCVNAYKKNIRAWTKAHPHASHHTFELYCEQMIPSRLYPSHKWLIDASCQWWQHQQRTYLSSPKKPSS